MRPYKKNPEEIYKESFATVVQEANLDRFSYGLDKLATRVIHACGMIDVADRLAFSERAFTAGTNALASGAPILCDCEMLSAGIIRRFLPAKNKVVVTLNDPSVAERAKAISNTLLRPSVVGLPLIFSSSDNNPKTYSVHSTSVMLGLLISLVVSLVVSLVSKLFLVDAFFAILILYS